MIKKKPIWRLWWTITSFWIIGIVVISILFSYYETIISNSDITFNLKQIHMIITILSLTFYIIIIFWWAILFQWRCKKSNDLRLIQKYFMNYFLDEKIEIKQLDQKYNKKIKKNLSNFAFILNFIIIFFVTYTTISLIFININNQTLLIYLLCSIIFLLIPSWITGLLLIYYKNAVFV